VPIVNARRGAHIKMLKINAVCVNLVDKILTRANHESIMDSYYTADSVSGMGRNGL